MDIRSKRLVCAPSIKKVVIVNAQGQYGKLTKNAYNEIPEEFETKEGELLQVHGGRKPRFVGHVTEEVIEDSSDVEVVDDKEVTTMSKIVSFFGRLNPFKSK